MNLAQFELLALPFNKNYENGTYYNPTAFVLFMYELYVIIHWSYTSTHVSSVPTKIKCVPPFILCSACTIANAVIIGYMTSYTEELNKKSAELSEKLNLINTAMLNLKLSSNLKGQITEYIY